MKTEAVKKSKIVSPNLRFKDFENDWEIKTLGDLADVSKLAGYEFTKHIIYSDDGKLIGLRGLNIKNNTLDLKEVKYIDKSDLSKLTRSKLYKDDLLFTYVGTIGQVALIPENDRYYLAPNVARIRIDRKFANPRFINQYFYNTRFRKNQINVRIATSSQPALSMSNIRLFKLQLPPLEEQNKIAEFLGTVDIWIENLKSQKKELEKYKKGVIQKIFSQEFRFKDADGNDFPTWEKISLEKLLKYEQPTRYLVENTEYEDTYVTPVLTAGKTFILGYTDEKRGIFDKDKLPVIIFDDFTTDYKFVNFPFKVKSSAMKILLNKDEKISDIRFIFYKMSTIRFSLGEEHKRYWISEYSKTKIDLPCLEEQAKVAEFLKSIDLLIDNMETQIRSAEQWKKGLLQKMFI